MNSLYVYSIAVYKEAYYKLISSNEPAVQANSTHNLCFQSVESKVSLTSFCHVFKIKEGLNNNYLKAKDGFALESACVPGYYLRQKNYKFVLAQGETTPSFGKNNQIMITLRTHLLASQKKLTTYYLETIHV